VRVIVMSKFMFALGFCMALLLYALHAVSQSAPQGGAGSDVSRPYMVVVPACPVGHTQEYTKELEIDYFPSREGAAITNPQSLTLRLVFNGRSWRDNDRTVTFSRKDGASWRATIPLALQWVYAIWYVRDDATSQRDDNHGQYWDVVFCGENGKKLSDGIRYQAEGYAGSIFSEDIKRTADYQRAISTLEGSTSGARGILLYDEWLFKLRRQGDQELAHQKLAEEIENGLKEHGADPDYLRETAHFLIEWRKFFSPELVEHAVDLSDRLGQRGMPSTRSELERTTAEDLKNPHEQVAAFGEWLAKYPNDRFYGNEIRKERLDLLGDLGNVQEAEAAFRDLANRVPEEADLYATMASIYIRHKVKLREALTLLDEAEKNLAADGESSGFLVILDRNPDNDKAALSLWRGKAFAELQQWEKAELFSGICRRNGRSRTVCVTSSCSRAAARVAESQE
jgi:hypothetical protein